MKLCSCATVRRVSFSTSRRCRITLASVPAFSPEVRASSANPRITVSAFFISCAKPAVSRPTVLVRCARSSAPEISPSRRCRIHPDATPKTARSTTARYISPPRLLPFQRPTTRTAVARRKITGPQYSAATATRRAACAASRPGDAGFRCGTERNLPELPAGLLRGHHAAVEALRGRRVLLCVGGGIAAYKSCEVARLCGKAGAEVRVALTPASQRFVTALTFQALTGRPASTDLFDAQQELAAGHIALADWAELAVVAPATADLSARLRIGAADDVVTATLLAIDPSRWLLAPAMNERMWASPATAENLRVLQERGARRVGPNVGEMAERTHAGPGRMAEPDEIVEAAARALLPRDLAGVPVLVTAGPTREALDPVRFLSNPSTGRMGFALAEAARDRGAEVTLIAGPTQLEPPAGVRCLRIVSAQELEQAVASSADSARVVVMAAAVADQRPAQASPQKGKKRDRDEMLHLARTPD